MQVLLTCDQDQCSHCKSFCSLNVSFFASFCGKYLKIEIFYRHLVQPQNVNTCRLFSLSEQFLPGKVFPEGLLYQPGKIVKLALTHFLQQKQLKNPVVTKHTLVSVIPHRSRVLDEQFCFPQLVLAGLHLHAPEDGLHGLLDRATKLLPIFRGCLFSENLVPRKKCCRCKPS